MMVLYDEEEAMRIYIESERYDRKSMGSKVIELQKVGNKKTLFCFIILCIKKPLWASNGRQI